MTEVDVGVAVRVCTKCKEEKDLSFFYGPSPKGRIHSWCKSCLNDSFRARKYGLSPSLYEALLTSQDGKCALCAIPFPVGPGRRSTRIDHSHKTGNVRGLLCHRCNIMLGMAEDDISLLERAIAYLEAS